MTLAHTHNNALTAFSSVTQVRQIIKLLTETISISDSVDRLSARTRTLTSPISITDSIQTIVTKQGIRNIIKLLTETLLQSGQLVKISGKKRAASETLIIVREGTTAKLLSVIELPVSISDTATITVTRQSPTTPERKITENVNASGILTRKSGKWRKIGSS